MSDGLRDRALTKLTERGEEASSSDRAGYDETALREAYGPVAGFVRANPARFEQVDRWLRQARFGTPVDEYVQRSVRFAGYGAVGGLLFGLLVFAAVGDSLTGFALLLGAVAIPLVGAMSGAGAVSAGRYAHPALVAHQRERRIDQLLPHATVFLYALSHGGMDLYEVIERIAETEVVYGEVATEFRLVQREMTQFDQDLFGAISTAKSLSPSEDLRTFFDELESVLETGGDIDRFLHEEARRHRELAEEHQEQLLEELGTLAEVYITVVFAGPIFLLVVLLVGSFIVPGLLLPMQLLVYLGLPLALLWLGVAIDYLLDPYRQHTGSGERSTITRLRTVVASVRERFGGSERREEPDGSTADRIARYRRSRHRSALQRAFEQPLATMREAPVATLAVTVPLGALSVIGLAFAGVAEIWLAAGHPVQATTALFVVPFLIAAVPFAYFHHHRRRRSRTLRRRLPTALTIIADADTNEVPLGEAFSLVARRMSGPLEQELDRINRDIRWNHDITGALSRFAERTAMPAVRRVSHLLQESVRATNDLAPVLRVVGDDLEARNDVRERQQRNMRPYVLVVFVGVLVYLGIVVLFDSHFLPMAARSAGALAGSPLEIGEVPTDTYHRLFFHSALIQAIGNGLLLGVLVDNRAASGVGYAAALVAIELGVFLVFV